MTKRVVIVAAAVALISCMAGGVQAQNLLSNPSFEILDSTDWILADRGGSGVVSFDYAHSGEWSAKIVGGVPNSMKQEDTVLDPSKTYQQSVWVFLSSLADPVQGTQIYFRAGWNDATGALNYDAGQSVYVTETNKWVKVVDPRTFTGYSNCFMWSVRAFSGDTPVYFDDAELSAVVPEPASMLSLLAGGLGMLGFGIRRRF